jgi:cysteine sulfinate desulfinase/cysteine desulfurase-like protein
MEKQGKDSFNPKMFLAKVGAGKTILEVRKNQSIFAQGEVADTIFYIQKGKVKLTVLSDQGKEAVVAILEESLRRLGHAVAFNGSGAARHPGNSNARFLGQDGRDLIAALQPRLAASSGSACSSGIIEPSHVLRAIGLTGDEADSSVRFSFGRFTTKCDTTAALELLSEALAGEEAA